MSHIKIHCLGAPFQTLVLIASSSLNDGESVTSVAFTPHLFLHNRSGIINVTLVSSLTAHSIPRSFSRIVMEIKFGLTSAHKVFRSRLGYCDKFDMEKRTDH